ncbi:MAG TPA: hypothetical protein VHW47_01780 [Acidimicrobiales bacterium]|jgi:serine/threonine-protein kinase RsbW|nr:hypothetical protein [Acidimicrobiales bacterium]
MTTDPGLEGVRIRLLDAAESSRLPEAIRAAYGDSYDAAWVYDPHLIARRISEGLMVSCIAETVDGELLCHAAMTFRTPHDAVGHAGQAVTLPAARGHHLFTAVKRHLAAIATRRGLAGMYSEATAAHPYSQRANIELGAHETGFLLGWIPASVANDAADQGAGPRRQSVALFFLKTNPGSARPVYAPPTHRDVVHRTVTLCGLHARLADPPAHRRLPDRSVVHSSVMDDHNLAVLTVGEPGRDLPTVVGAIRDRLFGRGLDALYLDLPLDHHATALVADQLDDLGVSYAGVFPNSRAHGDVLRLQSLNGVRITAADVAVASDHGRELLDYILADLPAEAAPQ